MEFSWMRNWNRKLALNLKMKYGRKEIVNFSK